MALDPIHAELLKFTDETMAKLVELEQRVHKLEQQVSGVLEGHAGDTRDELKKRVEALEGKLHTHFQQVQQELHKKPDVVTH